MFKIISKSNWVAAIAVFSLPFLLIAFLAAQMAYSQVSSKFDEYQNIQEITRLSELEALLPEQVVMLRGKISALTPQNTVLAEAPDLIVYQQRPADGREVRFREEFHLIFPEFVLDLPDGTVTIIPSVDREHIIQKELHLVTQGDRDYTGFKIGDTVMVQGQWQPNSGPMPALIDVTGITSADKSALIVDWQDAFQRLTWVRNILGVLTLAGIIVLVVQIRKLKRNSKTEDTDAWQNQKTKTAITT
jgi:hypothetical protein